MVLDSTEPCDFIGVENSPTSDSAGMETGEGVAGGAVGSWWTLGMRVGGIWEGMTPGCEWYMAGDWRGIPHEPSMSIGSGKMIVEFFSADMLFNWKQDAVRNTRIESLCICTYCRPHVTAVKTDGIFSQKWYKIAKYRVSSISVGTQIPTGTSVSAGTLVSTGTP